MITDLRRFDDPRRQRHASRIRGFDKTAVVHVAARRKAMIRRMQQLNHACGGPSCLMVRRTADLNPVIDRAGR
jgi:hypothetical protein